MKPHKTIFLFPILICLGIGAYLLVTFLLPSMNSSLVTPEPTERFAESISPTAVSNFLTGKTVYNSLDVLPDATVDDVKIELSALEQINLAFVRRPGWWHFVNKTWRYKDEINQQNRVETSEWEMADMFPPLTVYDRWFQLTDDEGSFGGTDLTIFSDEEGNPVQVLVSDDEGNGGNLTTMEHPLPDYLITPPDVAAEVDALPPEKAGSELSEIIEWLDSIRYISEIQAGLVSDGGTETYFMRVHMYVRGDPHELQWLPEPVIGYILTYRIDPTTGNLLETTTTAIGESGTAYLELTETLLIYECFDDLPNDAKQLWLSYMDQYWALIESQRD